jgi:hypothetical protein
MKNRNYYVFILLTLFVASTFFAGCGTSTPPASGPLTGEGAVMGRVVDEDEAPVAGATLSLYYSLPTGEDLTRSDGTLLGTETSDNDGGYSFENLYEGYTYVLVIEAAGRKTVKISFTLTEEEIKYLQSVLPVGEGIINALFPTPVTLETERTGDFVTLTWTESVNDNFVAYYVLRTETSDFDLEEAELIAEITEEETVTTTDELPEPDTTYYYRVIEKVQIAENVYIWVLSNIVDSSLTSVWSQLGDKIFKAAQCCGEVQGFDIAVNNGVVYVAFADEYVDVEPTQRIEGSGAEGYLWKYENGTWEQVGDAFSGSWEALI